MLPARLTRSWAELLLCGGDGAGGPSGLVFADAVGGGGAGGDSGDGAPSPVGTGGAATLPAASPASVTPAAADAADVAAPPASIAPAVSVAARAPPATAATPPVAATAATVAAPRATPFPISAAMPTRSPTTHPQGSRSDRSRHLGDHPRCKCKEKHRHESRKNLSDRLIGCVAVHRRDPVVRDRLEDAQHEVNQIDRTPVLTASEMYLSKYGEVQRLPPKPRKM